MILSPTWLSQHEILFPSPFSVFLLLINNLQPELQCWDGELILAWEEERSCKWLLYSVPFDRNHGHRHQISDSHLMANSSLKVQLRRRRVRNGKEKVIERLRGKTDFP